MPNHETSVRAEFEPNEAIKPFLRKVIKPNGWDSEEYRQLIQLVLDVHSMGYDAGMSRMREMAAQVAEDRFAENADSRYYEICSQKAEAIRKLGAEI